MFENYENQNPNRVPNNRKQFLNSGNIDSLIVGATNKFTFELDCKFDDYYKEAAVILDNQLMVELS